LDRCWGGSRSWSCRIFLRIGGRTFSDVPIETGGWRSPCRRQTRLTLAESPPGGFASVDPNDSAALALGHAIKRRGLRGLKLDPALQRFRPGCEGALRVYEKAEVLGIPDTFQKGLNWRPAPGSETTTSELPGRVAPGSKRMNIRLGNGKESTPERLGTKSSWTVWLPAIAKVLRKANQLIHK
jgi:hypothetical protein